MNNWASQLITDRQIKWRRVAVGGIIGALVSTLDLKVHLDNGIPYGGDMLSNLIPALYFRAALQTGSDPFVTPWYGGMALWENPFFKGFYPPWTVFFFPGVPLADWLAVLFFGHTVFAGIVCYYFARRELRTLYALPLAIIVVLPMVNYNAHISKTLAWPWLMLGAWQLRPVAITTQPRLTGALVGAAGAAILLLGNAYYSFYLAVLAGCIFLALRAWQSIKMAAITSAVVGAPKLLSFIPIVLGGGRDTLLGDGITLKPFVATLIGFWWESEFVVWSAINKDAYAVVSLPICLLAGVTLLWSYVEPERFPKRWILGCVAALLFGLLMSTASKLIYRWPLMDSFRVPDRAILIIAIVFVLLSVEFIQQIEQASIFPEVPMEYLVTGFLLIGLITATVPPVLQITMWEQGTTPAVGREVATVIDERDCRPVWLEINAGWTTIDNHRPYHKQIAFGLAERGIPAVATSYAKIGQEYSTHDSDGELTFSALILQGNASLPSNGSVTLTGGWFQPERGQINSTEFEVVEMVKAPRGPIRIYAPSGEC